MNLAIAATNSSQADQLVPVGCLLYYSGGYKLFVNGPSLIDHCELQAIKWGESLGIEWQNTVIYVTCEPCTLCLAALCTIRIKAVFFGCYNTKYGACGGKFDLLAVNNSLYKPLIIGGICEEQCENILKDFFSGKR